MRLDAADAVAREVLGRVEEEVREEGRPGRDVHRGAAEVARHASGAQHRARVVDASEDRQPERRVDLDADRVVGILGRRARDAFVGAREHAVPRRVEERAPARALERLGRAREIAGVRQKEVEIAHRAKRRVGIMEECEDRALQSDDLDARRAQRGDARPERFEKAMRAGGGMKIFFE